MNLSRRAMAAGGALLAGGLILSGCSSSDDSGSTGGSFSIAIEEPQSLVPSNCYDLYCANVLNSVFTGLYEFTTQEDGSITPELTALADSVETSDEGSTYTVKINSGWTFTNGEEITAKSFVDTYNYAANGGNGQQLGFVFGASQLNVEGYDAVSGSDTTGKKMSGITALDDTTIEFKLKEPLGEELFNNFLSGPQIFPMPSDAFTDEKAFNRQPIGNGPYMLTEPWSKTSVKVVTNPDYLGTPGSADKVEFKIYTDNNAQWADLQANNLDVVSQLPPNSLATAPTTLGDRYVNQEGALSFSMYGFPQQTKTFEEKDVRIAIAKAINWEEINQKIYFDTRQVATSFAPSTIPGGGADQCGEDCTFDAAKAKELLSGAGGLPGNKVQISALSNSTQDMEKAVCNQIQENLGVECSLKVFDGFGPMLDAYDKLGPDDEGFVLGIGWGADNPTIQNMIAPLFVTGAPSNYIGYSNPKFDKLIAEGNAAQTPEEQQDKWLEAEQVLFDDFVAYPTQARNTVAGYSTRVSNVDVNPQGFINTSQITVN